MSVFERNLIALEDFDFVVGGAVELHLTHVSADLHPVGAGVHPQRASDSAWNTDQAFHPAEVVLGAEGDRPAEVCRGVHARKITFKDRSEEHTSELQSRPHLVCRLLLEKKKINTVTSVVRLRRPATPPFARRR